MKILVVDDNPQNLSLLEVLLRDHGYEVTTAHHGAEALEKAEQDRCDLIIADILMPHMDGFQLCRAVKTHPQLHDVAFVFYSAMYTDPQDQVFALSLGADKFVTKPQNPCVLLAEVQAVLRQRQPGRAVLPPPAVDEAVYMQAYNARLIHRLEETVLALEAAHQQAAASEAQYRALVEQANDAVILFDPGGQVHLVNPQFCTWFGHSQADATRLHLRTLVHPAEVDRVFAAFQGLVSGERLPACGEVRCLSKTGALLYADMNTSVIVRDGTLTGVQAILRDVAARQQAAHVLREQATLAALETDIGRAMVRSESLPDMLGQCTEAIVRHLEAAFARVWILNDADNVLELQASAGMYTHLNGAHARVPVGQFKIGLIAQERHPHLTNAVTTDPRVGDKAWARQEGMVSFAGYPLLVGERLIGVIAMFARHPLSDFVLHALGTMANTIALGLERLHARHALRESEGRFRQLAEHIYEVFYLFEVESARILYISPAYARIWGRSAEALYQQATDFIEAVHPEDRASVYAMLDQHTRGEPTAIEYRIIRPDGTVRWIADHAFPFCDSPQNGYRVAGVAEDITERKQAEATLRESEARTRLIIDTALDAVIMMDGHGRITEWNTQAEMLFGWPHDEAVGRTLSCMIIPPRYREAHERGLRHYMETGQGPVLNRVVEIEALHRDGREFPVELAIVPLRGGGTVVFSAFLRDITARKQAEEALRQMNDVLEQRVAERTAALRAANGDLAKATRLKDEFLASMSHELRTPLNTILGLSEALQEQVYGPLTDKQGRSLSRIEESGRHLLALITDILDLSKIEAGKIELQMTPVDVEDVCQASLRLIRDSADQKHLTITSTMDHMVSTLYADERRLKQILVNLLSNAVKFTPAEGRIGLEVTGHHEEQRVDFTVWDTGIGIADAERERLFQPFVQLDSSLARHHAGTGLGLSLIARLAALHGGRITLESAVGQGSRFSLEMPWHAAMQDPAPAGGMEAPAPPLAMLECVMVVEDMPAHAEQLVRYLHDLAVHVTVYPHGEGVVDDAVMTHPDVILLDLGLPQGSGWEVLTQLKMEPQTRAIPVVIVSVIDEQSRALSHGAAAYLVKPVSREQVQSALHQAIASQHRQALVADVPTQTLTPDAGPLLLLAEENAMNGAAIAEYLHAKGYRVAVVGTGGDALAYARALHPALILMDIQMPEMDGIEATRRLRAEPDPGVAATPIIALTALAMPGDRERCLAAGANAYVTKPVKLPDLLQTIATQLQGEQDGSAAHRADRR